MHTSITSMTNSKAGLQRESCLLINYN